MPRSSKRSEALAVAMVVLVAFTLASAFILLIDYFHAS